MTKNAAAPPATDDIGHHQKR